MSRPAKAVDTIARGTATATVEARKETETRLKGKSLNADAPEWLNEDQQEIYREIVEHISAAGVLGSLDTYVVANQAVACERLRYIDALINSDPSNLLDSKLMAAREKYSKDFFRGCNELCMSPQARAKMGTLAVAKQKEVNPVKAVLAK